MRHFNQFGNDFSAVENYGYLIEIGGKKILHLGDVEYATENLEGFGLSTEEIDVVLIPTFNTLLSAASALVIQETIAPAHVVGLHFQQAQRAAEAAQVQALYPGASVFTEALQVIRR